ncbi:LuxR C-terminal-related transcriptional regulator [Nioella halotolerans]|uniref:LuxR C-terminal-related transcriptional regulator n=1 Tax=Nioella halotolerans TaxID=2303578 RepID=UPI003F657967
MATLSPAIIIDDDDFFRVAIDAVLRERLGVETVVICATMQEALNQLSGDMVFGLVLVDLNMPGISNQNLLDTFKAAQPDSHLVVLSASRSRDDILMALSAGAQGFINKGLGIRETEAALRRIADGAVYVPPFTPQSVFCEDASDPVDQRSPVPIAALTPRQLEVLRLLVTGLSNKGIARELGINPSTVKFHLSFIFQILGASNRVEAAMLGAELLKERE